MRKRILSIIPAMITMLFFMSVICVPAYADKTEKSGTLIIYFSAGNTKDADAVSSATIVKSGISATERIAEFIHENIGGDIVKLTPSVDYPLGYNDTADQARSERDNNARPKFESLGVDPESYQTVFIGYPIWWYTVPMIVETFFDTYDLSGVTIVPFNTHEGSWDGGTYDLIKEREPNATVLDGLALSGGDVFENGTEKKVNDWLDKLTLPEEKTAAEQYVVVSGQKLSVAAAINPTGINVTYSSSDKSIASVSSKGIVTGKSKAGTVTVTAKVTAEKNGKAVTRTVGECTIVNEIPKYSKSRKVTGKLRPDNTVKYGSFNAGKLISGTTQPCIWYSSDKSVMTVNKKTGKVTIRGNGKAYLYAVFGGNDLTDPNGTKKKYRITINVIEPIIQ